MPTAEPICQESPKTPTLETIVEGRSRDLGGFMVRRLLPSSSAAMVGPFIFFDHMGPAEFGPGHGLDVRPHPHINLATVTYLFEGEILHRDSLGSVQPIRPGEINWMTAGRGIVHSERTPPALRDGGSRLHGIQLWVALPKAQEEVPPSFSHHSAADLPKLESGGASLRLLVGSVYGLSSPVATLSELFYVDAFLAPGAVLDLPREPSQRAVYVVEGEVACGAERGIEGQMLIFAPKVGVRLASAKGARLMLLGGEPLDGSRHIWWNFVSSSPERIEAAKRAWKNGSFPKVPGDEIEFIPLPE